MIRSLSGIVLAIEADTIVIDVGGFGIEAAATAALIARAREGERIECAAYLQISDAGAVMYAFSDGAERSLFTEMLRVPGIGGRKAVAVLRHGAPAAASAIASGDASRLIVPGVGRALADKICANLRSRIEKTFSQYSEGASVPRGVDAEVCAGLMGLGFSAGEASRAAAAARADDPDRKWSEEELMMAALNKLRQQKDG